MKTPTIIQLDKQQTPYDHLYIADLSEIVCEYESSRTNTQQCTTNMQKRIISNEIAFGKTFLLALNGEQTPLGYLSMAHNGHPNTPLELTSLYVRPSERYQGYGLKLLEEGIEFAKHQGFAKIETHLFDHKLDKTPQAKKQLEQLLTKANFSKRHEEMSLSLK